MVTGNRRGPPDRPAAIVELRRLTREQLVHVGADELLDFTTLNPDMLNPVLRYQTGDAGRFISCPCGTPGTSRTPPAS